MELDRKTTILFPSALLDHLTQLAKREGVSMGELVRSACKAQYGFTSTEERLAAVDRMLALSLPVSTPSRMKRESVAEPKELLR